ncbi:MAG: hypothetical protein HC842_04365 [Cytophagales bacterium]|nr:hypothetical protein [Cytophagales bacterium]
MLARVTLVWLALLLTSASLPAQQFSLEAWHEGKVVLMTGDTVPGMIKYDLENELVQVGGGGVIQTYGARKILYFEFVDALTEAYRVFYALPFWIRPNYKAPLLFEVVYEGKMSLLSREYLVVESNTTYDIYNNPIYLGTTTRLVYDYYFLYQDGRIVGYRKKRKDLWKVIFKKHSSDMKKYIKENKLKADRRADLVRMVAHYNSL